METATQYLFDGNHLNQWIATEVEQGRIGACAVEIVLNGVSVYRNCYGRRTADGDPVTHSTQFWIASMTKPVVSAVVMHLVEAVVAEP